MNKKIFLFFMFLHNVMYGCVVKDADSNIIIITATTIFKPNFIKKEIIERNQNIQTIEFDIHYCGQTYNSSSDADTEIDAEKSTAHFTLKKINYKKPEDSYVDFVEVCLNNRIKNKLKDIFIPVYNIALEPKKNNTGSFIIFSDFPLNKILAYPDARFYYTKKDNVYDMKNQTFILKQNYTKHYIDKDNANNVIVLGNLAELSERYEFIIEASFSYLYVGLSVFVMTGLLMLYSEYDLIIILLKTKIAKFLSKEII